MNKRTALIHQLLSIRSSVDAALVMLDESSLEEEIEDDCVHPLNSRTDFTTMGGPERWQCQVCGFYYEGPQDEGGD